MPAPIHRVVIVGGGFAGLYAAQHLRQAPVQVTLIDRRNFHLFQPLLYQVATGGLSPANIAAPLRAILRRQKNAQVILGEVTGVDVAGHRVIMADGPVQYDTLIVATGSSHHYFGHDEWRAWAPGLKTIEDALEIRRRILRAFERAERESDPQKRQALLTFVVVGAGPTGVEMAGTIGELARSTLRADFRAYDTAQARIILVEGAERALPAYPPDLSAKAAAVLRRLGITLLPGAKVINVLADAVQVEKDGAVQRIDCRTVVWAAGVQASPLGEMLAAAAGVELDRAGRVKVTPELSLPGHPEIFALGDLAYFDYGNPEHPLPGLAPVAMQQGRYAAHLIRARLRGRARPAFRYRDRGTLSAIGRAAAVADLGFIHLNGQAAWLVWLFVHLMYLVEFENRVLVFFQWAWNYFTRNRSARLITEENSRL